jgi:MFS transporter, DHA1 family, multidrug resistance protein
LLIVILGMLSMLAPLGIDMYLPGLPTIASDLGASPKAAQFTLSAFMLGFALGQLVHGPAADSLGRKRVLIAGTLGYCLFSALCSTVTAIEMLIGLRVMQGLGGAASGAIVVALLRDIYGRKEDLARMMSFVTLVAMLAPLIAPLAGGYVLLWFGWRAVFWVLSVISFLAVLLVCWGIPETLPKKNRLPLHLGEIIRNYINLLSHRKILGYILTAAFPAGGMFAFITAGSFVYIELYGVSPQHFGFYFGLNVISLMGITLLNGRLVHQVGVRKMLEAGLIVQTTAGLWLVIAVMSELGFWALVTGVVLFVGSIAAITSNAIAAAMHDYPQLAGTLASLAGTLRFGTGALTGSLVAMMPSHTAASMVFIMACCALLAAVSYCCLARNFSSA